MKEELSAQEIVDGLDIGSKVIDEAKKKVERIVRMVLGFIEIRGVRWQPWEFCIFSSGMCEWQIQADSHGQFTICCRILRFGVGQREVYSTDKNIPFRSITAQEVCSGLPILIDNVRKKFPGINDDWMFILKAAGKYSREA